MSVAIITPKKSSRAKRKPKAQVMTKLEMLQKMIADQKLISTCRKNGLSYKEISKKYGFEFKTL